MEAKSHYSVKLWLINSTTLHLAPTKEQIHQKFAISKINLISQFHNHAQYVQAVCFAGNTSCKVEIILKYDKNISVIIYFKQYVHSFIQSTVFTGRLARQINRSYVLRMIVKLAYSKSLEQARSRGIVDRTKEYSFVLSTMPQLHARSRLLELGVWSIQTGVR